MMNMLNRIICILAAILSSALVQAQPLSLKLQGVSVKDAISSFESASGYSFVYVGEELDTGRKVDVNALTVNEAVEQIIAGQGLTYIIEGQNVILRRNIATTPAGSRPANPQESMQTVGGVVRDKTGAPIAGAVVMEKGRQSNAAVADLDGHWSLRVGKGAHLVASCLGFADTEMVVSGTYMVIVMEEDSGMLDEVVVIGYGTAKRKDLTGSVKHLSVAASPMANTTNIVQSLIGTSAGVFTTQSGYAGGNMGLSIRGRTSFSASQDPLVVVDGLIYNDDLNSINPDDVASIDILKDASAAAVYGSRSANGVVIITTKRGKTDKPTVSFGMNMGVSTQANYTARVMNAEQYVQRLIDYDYQMLLYQWYRTKPASPTGRPDYPDVSTLEARAAYLKSEEEKNNYIYGQDIDWLEAVTRYGFSHNYNLNVSGAGKSMNYYISGAYDHEEAPIVGDDFSRVTLNAKTDMHVTDWFSMGLNLRWSRRDQSGHEASWSYAKVASPLATYDFVTPGYFRTYFAGESMQVDPLANLFIDETDIKDNVMGVVTAHVDVPFIEGLSYDFNYSRNFYTRTYNRFYPTGHPDAGMNGKAIKNPELQNSWGMNHILSWSREFGKHSVGATMAYTREKRTGETTKTTVEDFSIQTLGFDNLEMGTMFAAESSAWQETNTGLMLRGTYGYDSRYLLTATIRHDGFSGFGPNDKYVDLPSVSVGWVASNEKFFPWKNVYLKMRLGYGSNGNQGIGRYSSQAQLTAGSYNYDDAYAVALHINTLGNPNLKWESTQSWNAGVDFGLFDSRISGSFDVFRSETTDVLVKRRLPYLTGYDYIWDNLGGLKNWGLEVELSTVNIKTSSLTWTTGATFSLVRDKITDLYGDGTKRDLGNSWFVGKSITSVYNLKLLGVWQEEDMFNGDIYPGWYPGQYKYADLDDNGSIDANDRKIIGNSAPWGRYSITSNLTWKNWSLYVLLNGAIGGDKWFLANNDLLHTENNPGDYVYRKNQSITRQYWTPENATDGSCTLYYCQPIFGGTYQSRGYLRVQDVSLSYSIPRRIISKTFLADARVFATCRNLWTFTGWEGWDPEFVSFPLTRSIMGGLKLSF